jgi:hypothetical protein
VAGRLRAEGVDRHRRGKDRRVREESGQLRRSLHFQAHGSPSAHRYNPPSRPAFTAEADALVHARLARI